MDGNRRYAVAKNKQKHEGHIKGLAKLEESLMWCKALGINELTVFALSKDNLKRAPIEVETLMNLCKDQFAKMARNGGIFHTEKIKIRILGDLSLLP
jgi:undecaprenyl diphosphate synthase